MALNFARAIANTANILTRSGRSGHSLIAWIYLGRLLAFFLFFFFSHGSSIASFSRKTTLYCKLFLAIRNFYGFQVPQKV